MQARQDLPLANFEAESSRGPSRSVRLFSCTFTTATRFVKGKSFALFSSIRDMRQEFVDFNFALGLGLELREISWAKCAAFEPGGCDGIPHFSLT